MSQLGALLFIGAVWAGGTYKPGRRFSDTVIYPQWMVDEMVADGYDMSGVKEGVKKTHIIKLSVRNGIRKIFLFL